MPIRASRPATSPVASRAHVSPSTAKLVRDVGAFFNDRAASNGLARYQMAMSDKLPGAAQATLDKFHKQALAHYPAASCAFKFKVDGRTTYAVLFENPGKHDHQLKLFSADGTLLGAGKSKTKLNFKFTPAAS